MATVGGWACLRTGKRGLAVNVSTNKFLMTNDFVLVLFTP